MVMNEVSRRKLSESRGVKLNSIDVSTMPYPSPTRSCLTPGGKNGNRGRPKQVTYADQRGSPSSSSVISQLTPSSSETPTSFFKNLGLTVDTSLPSTQSSLSSSQKRGYEQINVTVYRADMKGYKFSFPVSQKKTAKDMLDQLASHFKIDEKLFRSCCAIWIVSDLLELQLRDSHEPWVVRKKWPHLLKQYAYADEDEINKDEPLLFLRRNVHLGLEKEKWVEEKDIEALTEILYHSTREEIISGRYACDLDTSVRLAGLQMAIELGPYNEKKHSLKNICFEMPDFFPAQLRNAVKSFYLFGIPLTGRKNVEYKVFEAFQCASDEKLYPSDHARRKAYLEIARGTPLYGAAYFHGLVERRPAESVMDIKTMFLNATLPSVEVLLALNRNYCAVLSANQLELLFITSLSVCELGLFEVDEPSHGGTDSLLMEYLPVLYLSVEDKSSSIDRAINMHNEETEVPQRYTFLPVYTRQAQLVQFLHRTLSKLGNKKPTQNISICEERRMNPMKSLSLNSTTVENKKEEEINSSHGIEAEQTDSRKPGDDGLPELSIQKTHPKTPQFCLPSHMNKMCVARFDDSLRCLDAQGSLKKILQEVM